MKRLKFTKTNIEKLSHPEEGKREVKYFASNCSHLCIIVQPQPSLKKSYYAQWGKVLMQSDGTQKRSGRYKYICRFEEKTVAAVMDEVKAFTFAGIIVTFFYYFVSVPLTSLYMKNCHVFFLHNITYLNLCMADTTYIFRLQCSSLQKSIRIGRWKNYLYTSFWACLKLWE